MLAAALQGCLQAVESAPQRLLYNSYPRINCESYGKRTRTPWCARTGWNRRVSSCSFDLYKSRSCRSSSNCVILMKSIAEAVQEPGLSMYPYRKFSSLAMSNAGQVCLPSSLLPLELH